MRKQLSNKRIAKSSVVLALLSLAGAVVSFARETVMAALFGATALTDALLIAFLLPDFIRHTIADGPFRVIAVPTLARSLTDSLEAGRRSFERIGALVLFYILASCGLLWLGAPWIVDILGWGLSPEVKTLSKEFLLFFAVAMIFICWANYLMIVANSLHSFVVPALFSVTNTLVLVGCMIGLAQWTGLKSVPLGMLIASLAWVIGLSVYLARKFGIRPRLTLATRSPEVRALTYGFVPALLGTSFIHLDLMMDRFVLSGFTQGTVSAYAYAHKVVILATLLFTSGLGVFFTAMADAAAQSDLGRFRDSFRFASWTLLAGLLPISIFCFEAAPLLVKVIYERGAFTEDATVVSSQILQLLSLGLVAFVGFVVISRSLFALGEVIAPMRLGLYFLGTKLVLLLVFAPSLGARGVAIATVVTFTLTAFLGYRQLCKRLPTLTVTTLKPALPLAASLVVLWISLVTIRPLLGLVFPATSLGDVARLFALACIAGVAYLGAALAFGVSGISQVYRWSSHRILATITGRQVS